MFLYSRFALVHACKNTSAVLPARPRHDHGSGGWRRGREKGTEIIYSDNYICLIFSSTPRRGNSNEQQAAALGADRAAVGRADACPWRSSRMRTTTVANSPRRFKQAYRKDTDGPARVVPDHRDRSPSLALRPRPQRGRRVEFPGPARGPCREPPRPGRSSAGPVRGSIEAEPTRRHAPSARARRYAPFAEGQGGREPPSARSHSHNDLRVIFRNKTIVGFICGMGRPPSRAAGALDESPRSCMRIRRNPLCSDHTLAPGLRLSNGCLENTGEAASPMSETTHADKGAFRC